MKKIVFLTLAVIVFCSCSKKKENYTLDGVVSNPSYSEGSLISQQIANNQIVSSDTILVESGKFSFTGVVDSICLKSVYSPNNEGVIPFVYIVEKGAITIEISDGLVKVGGTPLNDKLQEFNNIFMGNNKTGRDLVAEFDKKQEAGTATPEEEAELRETLSKLAQGNDAAIINFAKENADNILGEYCFMSFYFRVSKETREQMDSFVTPKIKALLNL